MVTTSFTPIASILGGALIGLSAVMLMAFTGRIAAPLLVRLVTGSLPSLSIVAGAPVLVIAGLLVGFGSVWGNGCTSGHGVCGISRLSMRSLAATAIFMATAIVTVFLTRHWG